MESNIIEFRNVGKCYVPNVDALKNITFELKTGEMMFLTGHSGAGKSTLLKIVAGLEKPTNGEVFVAEQNLRHLNKKGIDSLHRALGMVFQDAQLLEQYTVYENVALPLSLAGYRNKEIASRVARALEAVNLATLAKRYVNMLSIGEQQRIGIARAIAHQPPLLLADEPTGNLDPKTAAEIMQLFVDLNKNLGMSIVVATHDLTLIAPLQCRVLNLA